MQTDLAKILAVSGQHGLFQYIAQARNGVIAENIEDKKRTVITGTNRISSLADIAVYTSEGEVRLSKVFLAVKDALGNAEAPSSKADEKVILDLFKKAIPDYDSDRFYLSHMRKIIDWYSCLIKYASLDFVKEDEQEEA